MTNSGDNLVSIIIPCYNQEKWLREAIESALAQTYPYKEIIVVDDGSTDRSLQVAKRYEESIRIIEMPHQNGNYARNEGFRQSKGGFIQFLDADDYLLPEKITKQVQAMKEKKYDVVYSDWKHLYSFDNHHSYYGEEKCESLKSDYIKELIKGWWVAPVALLFSRKVVENVAGWDQSFEAAQDRDFFLSIAISGVRIGHVKGCESIYRRHSASTVSTGNQRRWLENHVRALQKAQNTLSKRNMLSDDYKRFFAEGYFKLARIYYKYDHNEWLNLYHRVLELDNKFSPKESAAYNFIYKCFGFQFTEKIADLKKGMLSVK